MGGPQTGGGVPFLRHEGAVRFDGSQARPWLVQELIPLVAHPIILADAVKLRQQRRP